MYTKEEEAIQFMNKSYKGQKFKNTNIDKAFYSTLVGVSIKNITSIEDVIIAAFLHNIIIETEFGYEDIEERFGTLVADLVEDVSEDLSIAKWVDRKKDFLKRMKKIKDVNAINIIVADKMQMLLSYYELFNKKGDKFWTTTGSSKSENCWLYREVYNIAADKEGNKKLLKRYANILKEYFGEMDEKNI